VFLVQSPQEFELRALLSATTHAVSSSVGAPLESIRVVIREVARTHWAAGDVTIAERDAARQATSEEETP